MRTSPETAVAPAAAAPLEAPKPVPAHGPNVTIPSGTSLRVRLSDSLSTKQNQTGDRFTATLERPVEVAGRVVIPRGTTFTGRVISASSSGRLRGRAALGIQLVSFRLSGKTYPVQTAGISRVSSSHNKRNLGLIGGGSGLGAAIGAIAGGGRGALIGAGAGAAAGTAGAIVTGKKQVSLPVETLLTFSLQAPVRM